MPLFFQILMLFVILIAISLISAIASEIWTSENVYRFWYLGYGGKNILNQINIFI